MKSLVEENIKLVYSCINKSFPSLIGNEDVTQSGMFGLVKAANKFDESRGVPFSSFAYRYIRYEVLEYLKRCKKGYCEVSLSEPVAGEDEGLTLEDTLSDPTDKFDDLIANELCQKLEVIATEREREIISLKLEGYKNIDISKKLGISKQNVSASLRKLFYKFKMLEGVN